MPPNTVSRPKFEAQVSDDEGAGDADANADAETDGTSMSTGAGAGDGDGAGSGAGAGAGAGTGHRGSRTEEEVRVSDSKWADDDSYRAYRAHSSSATNPMYAQAGDNSFDSMHTVGSTKVSS